MAGKVAGVGSVGTHAWIILFEGIGGGDPLLLQAEEAQASVLSGFVKGTGLSIKVSGWSSRSHWCGPPATSFSAGSARPGPTELDVTFCVRQLRDGKGSVVVEQMVPDGVTFCGRVCGHTVARGHARSADRVATAAYLGCSDKFDRAAATSPSPTRIEIEADQQAPAWPWQPAVVSPCSRGL